MKIKIFPSSGLSGTIKIPSDKSISHRSVIIGSLCEGDVEIDNFLNSEDCLHTLNAFKKLGVEIHEDAGCGKILIKAKGPHSFKKPNSQIYLGNSGTSMRLMLGLLSGQDFETVLTGDESLNSRPMDRVTVPLALMGAKFSGRHKSKYAPITVKGGRLKAVDYVSPVSSAQVKSALMLAGIYADGASSVSEPYKSRDHTEKMMEYFGVDIETKDNKVTIFPPKCMKAKSLYIPGDISSAMYFILASVIIPGSCLVIEKVGVNPTRTGAVDILKKMGADIKIKNLSGNASYYEPVADIEVQSGKLKGIDITKEMIPSAIDEIPLIMVAGCFAEGTTRIFNASELRVKETDRIESMVTNLRKMGADIIQENDDIIINHSVLAGSRLTSFDDHRTAMSLTVAAVACGKTESILENIECINTSFPGFFDLMAEAGIKFDFIK